MHSGELLLREEDREGLYKGYKHIDIFISVDGEQQQEDNELRGAVVEEQPMRGGRRC